MISNDRPYAGVVQSVDKANDSCVVRYFEYSTVDVTLKLSGVSRISPGVFTREEVSRGFKCMCKFNLDQSYYEVSAFTSYTHPGNIHTFNVCISSPCTTHATINLM